MNPVTAPLPLNDGEQWKDVPGFEGTYMISNHGRLMKLRGRRNIGYPRIMSVTNGKGWYLTIILRDATKRKTARIHRLVAEAFLPNPKNKPEVNHKDCNKQNNRMDNLEWSTRKENGAHAIKNIPRMLAGMNHYNRFVRPRPIQQVSLDGRVLREFPNATEAGRHTGVCHRNILQVAGRIEYKPGKIRRQAGGYSWRFSDAV